MRTGALDEVEADIERLVVEARTALADAPITETARAWLDELAAYVAWRDCLSGDVATEPAIAVAVA